MRKADKKELVNDLSEELKEASAVVLVNYSGMDFPTQQELNSRLKEAGARMTVVKNTLFKIAADKAGFPEETLTDTVLSGQNALVITTEDPVAPVQILGKFMGDHELPEWRVGVIEGTFQSTDNLVKLSKLPGKEVLYSQVIGSIMAPAYGLVGTLSGNLQKLVYILDQARQQKGGE